MVILFTIYTLFMFPILGSLPLSPVEQAGYFAEIEHEITQEFKNTFTAPSQEFPILILVGGFQGSGKSTLITRINQVFNSNVIPTDAIRNSLFDRKIEISSLFSKYVSNISNNLVKQSLTAKANTIIDANAHSSRIAEMEKLLVEANSHHTILKIFLNASEANLRNRVNNREQSEDRYNGTEGDLKAALKHTIVNLGDYDLIINTDDLNENDVFKVVNEFIAPFFRLQLTPLEK